MRLLWWLGVALAALWLLRRAMRSLRARAAAATPPVAAPTTAPQVMVRCAHCGVHLAQADAVEAQGRHYCDTSHRDAGPRPLE
jgi:uncharacterized protein